MRLDLSLRLREVCSQKKLLNAIFEKKGQK